jgi:hypothetical protein
MVVMEPEHTLDGQPELIVSVDKSLYTLDFHTATRRVCVRRPRLATAVMNLLESFLVPKSSKTVQNDVIFVPSEV